MNITLKRREYIQDGIFGDFYTEDGRHFCVSLEHAFGLGPVYTPKLAKGVYTCKRGTHKLHNGIPFETFEVMNVPPFEGKAVTGILIHSGNYNSQSSGCILVGDNEVQSNGAETIIKSVLTFKKFMDLQLNVDSFILTVA